MQSHDAAIEAERLCRQVRQRELSWQECSKMPNILFGCYDGVVFLATRALHFTCVQALSMCVFVTVQIFAILVTCCKLVCTV